MSDIKRDAVCIEYRFGHFCSPSGPLYIDSALSSIWSWATHFPLGLHCKGRLWVKCFNFKIRYWLPTLGYHISPTLSRNCLVLGFLLRVVILYWCLRVILNAPGMVWGCDPGPGLTWTMALGHGLCFMTQVHWVMWWIAHVRGLF